MNSTGKRIIQKILAILIILSMTMADLCLVGVNLVSYAIDLVETNNENVEFNVYFMNENKTLETAATIGKTDLKLAIELSVKKDGYLTDGRIELDEASNFKFKTNNTNRYVNKIEERTIYLNQINEGDMATIEVGIEFVNLDEIDRDYLSKTSTISLSGSYINSKSVEKNKSIEIKGKANLKINWQSSNEIKSVLKADLLTNSTYTVDEANKHIVQLLVASNVENNSYPVKNTNIELQLPNSPESVRVHKRTTKATNGDKEFGESNYEYIDGKLTINVQNGQEGKIAWLKNEEDTFVVTIQYPEDVEITNSKVSINSTITTYDEKSLVQNAEVYISEEKEEIVSTSKVEEQNEISKGNLYAGETKIYSVVSNLYVDYAKSVDEISLEEQKSVFVAEQEKSANIEYVQTSIDRAQFVSLFGENGIIRIEDEDGNVIANITSQTEVDENGKIIVKFNQGITKIRIATSKPQKEGYLSLIHQKRILKTEYSREEVKEMTKIKDSVITTYKKKDNKTNTSNSATTINLKETESKAKLEVEPVTLSTSQEKQDLEIRAVLETNNENRDLYKKPVLKVKLPKQITSASYTVDLLNGNGLKLGELGKEVQNNQLVIIIPLEGEQKAYPGEAEEGPTIIIKATVGLNKLATNSSEEIILNYTNENATIYADKGEEKVKVDIVSENSMILTNNINEYKVTTLGQENDKEVNLEVNSEAKSATVKMQVVNNEETEISNVVILGKIANESGKIERTSKIRTNLESAKVYYTTVENPTTDINKAENSWKQQDMAEAKNYLVIVGNLKDTEQINLSYDISIAKNLTYNVSAETNYTVYYTNNLTGTSKYTKSTNLVLTTGKVAEFKMDLEASVAGDEIKAGDTVKAGEIITYTAKVSNIGKQKAENVELNVTIPENTKLIEINQDYLKDMDEMSDDEGEEQKYFVQKSDKVINKTATIEAGKTAIYTYMVKVNEDLSETKNGETKIVVKYEDKEVQTASIENKFETASLIATLIPIGRMGNEKLNAEYNYIYELDIYNPTDKEQKNVEVTINKNGLVDIKNIDYTSGQQDKKIEGETLTFTIDSIAAKDTAYVEVDTAIRPATENLRTAEVSTTVKDSAGIVYKSNKLVESVEETIKIEAELTSSKATTEYISEKDEIKYTIKVKNSGKEDVESLSIEDRLSDYLELQSITLNGKNCEYTERSEFGDDVNYNTLVIDAQLKAGEEVTIEIVAKVSENLPKTGVLKVINKVLVDHDTLLAETDENVYYIESIEENDNIDDKNENKNDNNDGNNLSDNNENNSNENQAKYVISGIAWLDVNQNGSRDAGEELLQGIKVYAIDVSTNKIATDSNGTEISAMTNSEGFYVLANMPEGKYIIAFEYDTEKYIVTLYQADGVGVDKNSDAVKATRVVNGEQKTLAFTDSINLKESKANIDLGLLEAKVFDLELEKVISKMIVTNSAGTKTYDFEDASLAKVEIASKNLSESNVVVEYKIKIRNNGEIAGYVKSIVDYVPSSLIFNSGLNKDWYQQGGNLYNVSLANTKIEPGETKEVTLTLTKKMTESNTGLTNNKAEIQSAYNSLGVQNTSKASSGNSLSATKDKSSADAIITVKTGAATNFMVLIVTLTIIVAICGVAYFINKKILTKRIKI